MFVTTAKNASAEGAWCFYQIFGDLGERGFLGSRASIDFKSLHRTHEKGNARQNVDKTYSRAHTFPFQTKTNKKIFCLTPDCRKNYHQERRSKN